MGTDGNGKVSLEVESPQLIATKNEPPGSVPAPAPLTGPAANVVSAMNQFRKVVAVIGIIIFAGSLLARTRVFGKGLGQFVFKADECRSGKMLTHEGGLAVGGICTKDCNEDKECGSGFRCDNSSCVPLGSGALGQTCSAPWDCQSQLCVTAMPGLSAVMKAGGPTADQPRSVCTQRCDDSNPCPTGFNCASSPGSDRQFCIDRANAPSLMDLLQQGN